MLVTWSCRDIYRLIDPTKLLLNAESNGYQTHQIQVSGISSFSTQSNSQSNRCSGDNQTKEIKIRHLIQTYHTIYYHKHTQTKTKVANPFGSVHQQTTAQN